MPHRRVFFTMARRLRDPAQSITCKELPMPPPLPRLRCSDLFVGQPVQRYGGQCAVTRTRGLTLACGRTWPWPGLTSPPHSLSLSLSPAPPRARPPLASKQKKTKTKRKTTGKTKGSETRKTSENGGSSSSPPPASGQVYRPAQGGGGWAQPRACATGQRSGAAAETTSRAS